MRDLPGQQRAIALIFLIFFTIGYLLWGWEYLERKYALRGQMAVAVSPLEPDENGCTVMEDSFPRSSSPARRERINPHQPVSNTIPHKIKINDASARELDTLPGIGPVIARQIIEYRTQNGPFQCLEDLLKVNGIGPVKLAKISSLVIVP